MKSFTGTVPRPPEQVRAEIDQVARAQGWAVHPGAFPAVLTLAKDMSSFSWGSTLRIRVATLGDATHLTIEPHESGVLFDWGRGRRAATRLVAALGGTLDAS